MAERKKPQRTCVACKKCQDKAELIRVIKAPQGAVIDESGKLDGRGAYLCKSAECLEKANKKRLFSKSFKMDTGVDIYDKLKSLLK